jgi:protease I
LASIAFLLGGDFEDSEFRVPYDRLREAGHRVTVLGVDPGEELKGKRGKERIRVDRAIDSARPEEFDALVIPGGYSPDKLRMHRGAGELTRQMYNAGKPVAAICHAGSLLVEADIVRGKTLTSWPSIRTDLTNAGATWKDAEVVEDGNLITSRKPDDLDAFCAAVGRAIERQTAST